jgi:hypothetical protein
VVGFSDGELADAILLFSMFCGYSLLTFLNPGGRLALRDRRISANHPGSQLFSTAFFKACAINTPLAKTMPSFLGCICNPLREKVLQNNTP